MQIQAEGSSASARILRQIEVSTLEGLRNLQVHHTTSSTGQGLGPVSMSAGWTEKS